MNNTNYHFILADDHKGNKALAVIKGKPSAELADQARSIDDSHFKDAAELLKRIIDDSSVKDGDKPCN